MFCLNTCIEYYILLMFFVQKLAFLFTFIYNLFKIVLFYLHSDIGEFLQTLIFHCEGGNFLGRDVTLPKQQQLQASKRFWSKNLTPALGSFRYTEYYYLFKIALFYLQSDTCKFRPKTSFQWEGDNLLGFIGVQTQNSKHWKHFHPKSTLWQMALPI